MLPNGKTVTLVGDIYAAWKESKYGVFLIRIFPYSVQMRENTDQKKLCIWTLFTQWKSYWSLFCRAYTIKEVLLILVSFQKRSFTDWHISLNAFKKWPLGFLRKEYSENMQQVYKRTPMPKCDFNEAAIQLSWSPFYKKTYGGLLLSFR